MVRSWGLEIRGWGKVVVWLGVLITTQSINGSAQEDGGTGAPSSSGGVSLPSSVIGGPSVRITEPENGAVFGHIRGFRCEGDISISGVQGILRGFELEDFQGGSPRYELVVNGQILSPGDIRPSSGTSGALEFQMRSSVPYFPTTGVRGDTARFVPSSYPRFPWLGDFSFGWDKRLRGVLVEVIERGNRDLDHYVARDVVTVIDPRTPNCSNHQFDWKGSSDQAEDSFTVQMTPRHLKALEPVVAQNLVIEAPDTSGVSLYSDSSNDCMRWGSLPSEAKDLLRDDFARLIAALTIRFGATRPDFLLPTHIRFCRARAEAELTSVSGGTGAAEINPTVNPLRVDVRYDPVSIKAELAVEYFLKHAKRPIYRVPVLPGTRSRSCEMVGGTALVFDPVRLSFVSQRETVLTHAGGLASARESGSLPPSVSDPICGLSVFETAREQSIQAAYDYARRYYQTEINRGYSSSSPRHAISRAMDVAIYPLSTGRIVPERMSGVHVRATPSVEFIAGSPTRCEAIEAGAFVEQSFLSTPATPTSWGYWPQWNSGKLIHSGVGRERLGSTCPIVGTNPDGSPIFNLVEAYQAPLLTTTSVFNQILAARAGGKWDLTLDTVSDAEARTIVGELGLPGSSDYVIRLEGVIPPLIGPEWFYQGGEVRIRVREKGAMLTRPVFESVAYFFLDQNLSDTAGLGVGDPAALDDGIGLSGLDRSRLSWTHHSLSSGAIKPTRAQLHRSFDLLLTARAGDYLVESLRLIGNVEYARTPPSDGPVYSVSEGARETVINGLILPLKFR